MRRRQFLFFFFCLLCFWWMDNKKVSSQFTLGDKALLLVIRIRMYMVFFIVKSLSFKALGAVFLINCCGRHFFL